MAGYKIYNQTVLNHQLYQNLNGNMFMLIHDYPVLKVNQYQV